MTEWQPIETAPKDGTDILLWYPAYKRGVWIGAYNISETYDHGKLSRRSEGWSAGLMPSFFDRKPNEPTLWQPLPADPASAEIEAA